VQIKFLGAAGTVTGSRTLLESKSQRILIDCGLFQGPKPLRNLNWQTMPFAKDLHALLLTHAHLDHVGASPLLFRDGFRGPVYLTRGTAALAELILRDAAKLQEEDAEFANRTGYSNHRPAEPLYKNEDVDIVLKHFNTLDRGEWFPLNGFRFRFGNAGHIVGSSFIEIEDSSGYRIVFSGDLGSESSLIMRSKDHPEWSNAVVLESTYGDRVNGVSDTTDVTLEHMAGFINKALPRGRVLIPAFSVGRSQEVLFAIKKLMKDKRIPEVPVYLDSPMAQRATRIYAEFVQDLKSEAQSFVRHELPSFVTSVESFSDSQELVKDLTPKIVVSASGMLTGGRVMHHLKTVLPRAQDLVLFVGYQAAETKGRLLIDGLKELRIHHQTYPVRCQVGSLKDLSSHADQRALREWLLRFADKTTRVFLNHGEAKALFTLKERIYGELKVDVAVPLAGEVFHLS
jgi:metallo-beta-lactamase family protein